MIKRKTIEYAIYKGDKFIDFGTCINNILNKANHHFSKNIASPPQINILTTFPIIHTIYILVAYFSNNF